MTAARDDRPTRRRMTSRLGDPYVVELGAATLRIRPRGTRSARVLVTLEVGSLYLHALRAQLEAERAERARAKRKRGRR